jgi:HAD superfamily hydrolase (TIGR01509 family)
VDPPREQRSDHASNGVRRRVRRRTIPGRGARSRLASERAGYGAAVALEWTRGQAAVIDVDGTLVDTNYHHVVAWDRAFDRIGTFVATNVLHRHVGMGGDQFVGAVAGDELERERGDEARALHDEIFRERFIDHLRPYPDARRFLGRLGELGLRVVLASSARQDEIDRYLDLLDARGLCDAWTSSADVEKTKPHPDLLEAAIEKAGAAPAFLVGDSVWDCEAARRIGLPTLALMTGGFGRDELVAAGAAEVFDGLPDALERIEALEAVRS